MNAMGKMEYGSKKKMTGKQGKIAAAAKPTKKITKADFKALKKMGKKK